MFCFLKGSGERYQTQEDIPVFQHETKLVSSDCRAGTGSV